MRQLRKLGLVLGFSLLMPLAAQAATLGDLTKALEPQPGFIDVWRDPARGRVLLSLSAAQLDQPFLLLSSLPFGLGSNDVGLDRGQPGESRLVHFEKRGAKLLLVQENTRFRASAANPAERTSVVEAFASSVLWSGEILASEEGKHLVDFSSFLLADRHGVINRLRDSRQGAYRVDDKRSAVLVENSKGFPANVELEALLTFDGTGEGNFVRDVAMEASSLSLRQHISLIKLPEPGFQPRAYHPASGGIDIAHADFSTPLASSLNVAWQIRHRLEKTDPSARLSPVKKPIVYYLDSGTPEPVRSALLDGARWWATAFEKAGFKDAYRVEMLPEGADPMDARYNVIQWVHRATRGWSYGAPISDPRTGEIIKGVVMLGSQRVRQDILIAESLLAAYAKGGEAKQKQALDMALARLRQLSAHEVGHTLGFSHNFAASRAGNGSVMDYPHPLVKLDAAGEVDLREAYGVGLGPWDDFIVAHAYGQFGSAADEAAALARLRAQARAQGLLYVGDSDSRSPGSQHPDGVLWDFGADSIKTWDQLMAVRQRALRSFSVDVLPPERQLGELEARLVPVYLLHRYQGEALAHLLGGAEFEYGLAGDARSGAVKAGARPVPAAVQRQALARLVGTLRAESLALPAALLDQLTPPAEGYERGREYFANRMATQFDPLAAAQAAAAHFGSLLMNAERLNRLAWQQGRDAAQPGVGELLDQLLKATWQRDGLSKGVPGAAPVQTAVNWVVVDGLLGLLDGGRLHAGVDAELRQRLRDLAQWLQKQPAEANRREAAALIQAYLANPQSVKLRRLPAVPPGAPI
ncbi:zinc-dependent metalloprotease [Pelomonas sp. V22]|uniref:zinc-dependent metalloprotease n=1 Tax=Pelomonas sp. V22 TaxID=2822139 RepID=UPI0024A87E2C|nr:zinc-dependent metalloprotease [Pelomonas sp. V22]MDI4632640.1 zinc-dependent metalloprotease [Pelomonas sp. V22]